MYIIKPCPSCGKKVRFPIDKGKIRIRCECGNDFIADPDDPSLYKDATFDIKSSAAKKSNDQLFHRLSYRLKESIKSFKMKEVLPKTINRILDYKYKIQNFKLLPTAEQRKIILFIIIATIILIVIIYLFLQSPQKIKENKMVI